MDRRKFLRSLTALGAGSALPALALNETRAPVLAAGTQSTVGDNGGDFHTPESGGDWEAPRIGIVAIGGAGSAILSSVGGNFPYLSRSIVVDTDPFALHRIRANQKILVGNGQKLDAIATVRLSSATKCQIGHALDGLDVVFILAGMGGNAGSAISLLVADITGDAGLLTIAAAMTPFDFEGERCQRIAQAGRRELCRRVNAFVPLLPNEQFFRAVGDGVLIESALDQVSVTFGQLYRGIATLLGEPGLVGIDPQDIREMLSHIDGYAAVGYGCSSGHAASEMAIRSAINSPLLGEDRLRCASGILLSIEGKPALLKMKEISKIVHVTRDLAPDVNLIFGGKPNSMLTDDFCVTLLASGFRTV